MTTGDRLQRYAEFVVHASGDGVVDIEPRRRGDSVPEPLHVKTVSGDVIVVRAAAAISA